MKHNRGGIVFGSALSVIFFALAALLLMNRQYILDQWNVWQYKPTAAIANISQRAGLSDNGRFYLYTSHAEVDNAAEFNSKCARLEARNAILGCYSNRDIYIYDVNNSELDGVEEVTAAHEMLHAIWDRMGDSDKKRIGAMLEAEYKKIATPALDERLAYYGRNESGERQNELHSILGTEVITLDSGLEDYYSKYFTDRHQVTTLHAKYEQVFTQLSNESEALYNQLVASGKDIETLNTLYNQEVASLRNDIQSFNNRANNGGFSSAYQFNSERAALVARTKVLDAKGNDLNSKIATYNDNYSKYQALTVRGQTLNRSIDSTVAPAPSL